MGAAAGGCDGYRLVEQPLPFRCVDSFTDRNPYCARGSTAGRAEIEARRSRAMAGIAGFAAQALRVSVWDPLSILCPAEIGHAFRDGLPAHLAAIP